MAACNRDFPPFDLSRLLRTVFAPEPGQTIALLIDLDNPQEIVDFAFLEMNKYQIQKCAYEVLFKGLQDKTLAELQLKNGDIYAYKRTGGSNLDLPDEAYSPSGVQLSLEKDVYQSYDIILCASSDSATAPLTVFAKQYGFRGATMHGLNPIIVSSGLSVDYDEVSAEAEKIRRGMTKADSAEIDFVINNDQSVTLKLILDKQEAQKSHGLCRGGPDIANIPAGEVYFVPTGAEGQFPLKLEDGTIGLMTVSGGAITDGKLISGNPEELNQLLSKIKNDPAAGAIGELGFGTQCLPVSGQDIQDEKILGTVHVATGRSDHLGGDITPTEFHNKSNATHDDILFSPEKTPEVNVPQVRLHKDGEVKVLIENYTPIYMQQLLDGKA